ncbi:MAG TPA: sugar phosphate nucleotidyltransferase [Rhodothermales bacterium]|nr:glucose-1-phosphate thymidylyltransferase [Bacteroidota bacterium]HRK72995.1 sugar phosphate nucleotidyltransferase [Rhodothermales bacterium]HRR08230.1 sugar phosphate nucleotidyltransferase [Rhodothermales bacterium]
MRLIIPMAGRGTRLRPHTHVTPKPLLPVLGSSMVERIVTTFTELLPNQVQEAVFILGDFPTEVRDQLRLICRRLGIKASFAVQDKAMGTAHALYCAKEYLEGEVFSIFADTLFYMEPDFKLDSDVVAWVKLVEDPRAYGVVVRDKQGRAVGFVEKPTELISREALIGIYYIKDGARLKQVIQDMMDEKALSLRGEYELPDAFDRMLQNGATLDTATVTDWLDCGTLPALLDTTKIVMQKERSAFRGNLTNTVIIEPVYIGPGALIRNSVIGPFASIEAGATITDSIVRDSIVFSNATIEGAMIKDSFVGQHAFVKGFATPINVGDHASVG